jgi:hypothetical protein
MIAPNLSRCRNCFNVLHPCYLLSSSELCEDCQADEWERIRIVGTAVGISLTGGSQSNRRKRAPASDSELAEYLQQLRTK